MSDSVKKFEEDLIKSQNLCSYIDDDDVGGTTLKEAYFAFAKEFFNTCIETSRKKNADYTGGSENPFANFEGVEVGSHGAVTTEQGFVTRMYDKFARISAFVKNGDLQVKDESVKDTLLDLANYCCLFAGYLGAKKSREL